MGNRSDHNPFHPAAVCASPEANGPPVMWLNSLKSLIYCRRVEKGWPSQFLKLYLSPITHHKPCKLHQHHFPLKSALMFQCTGKPGNMFWTFRHLFPRIRAEFQSPRWHYWSYPWFSPLFCSSFSHQALFPAQWISVAFFLCSPFQCSQFLLLPSVSHLRVNLWDGK